MGQECDEGIIRPLRARGEPMLPADVLMVMLPGELDRLARRIGAKAATFRDMAWYGLYLPSTGQASPCSLAGPFLGAPQAVMGLEKLIALGAKRFWFLGWCGSISPAVRMGHFVLPAGAFAEEGTSRHYALRGRQVAPDRELADRMEDALRKARVPFHRGPIWTTDAPYRETPRKVLGFQKRGALAVEMEVSALMKVALFRGVRMCALLVVSDELFDLKWRHGFKDPMLRKRSRMAADILLDVVLSLDET